MGWDCSYLEHKEIVVEVDQVVGKQRARTVRANGVTRSYTPHKTVEFESAIRNAWLDRAGTKYACFTGPVTVRVLYMRELAKSNPKYWGGRKDMGKPDVDNVLKSVLDALNGVAYKDDVQVFAAGVEKLERSGNGCGNLVVVRVSYFEETYEKE